MIYIIIFTIFMTLLGALSSGIGGFLSSMIKIENKKILASLFEFTAGIMTGIVCIDMIPESVRLTNIYVSIFGILCGTYIIYLIEKKVSKNNEKDVFTNKNNKSIMSLVIILSMSIHNIIEGIAIGTSFSYSYSLGITILISIFIHDIPEGMVVGLVDKVNDKIKENILFDSIIVGMSVGIGVLIGLLVGRVGSFYTSFALSLSGGGMLYIVACELIPNSKNIILDKKVSLFYIVGIILSILITNV